MGGNPPCATQFNPGKDADDLIAAGLMQDLTELADQGRLEEHRPSGVAARGLHEGRQGLLRAGQPALGAVDVDQPARLRGRRPDAADELGRGGRRRAEAQGEGHPAAFRGAGLADRPAADART